MKLSVSMIVAAAGLGAIGSSALAGPFGLGNLVVSRLNVQTTVGNSAPVFLDEYTTGGSLQQSVAVPTAASGANFALTIGGSTTSAGQLARSADGRFLLLTGTDAPVNTTTPNSNGSFQGRTIARVDLSGSVDTSTRFTAAGTTARSVASQNGSSFYWTADTGSGSTGGLRTAAFGGSSSSLVTDAAFTTNVRVTNIAGGQLYASASSGVGGPWRGVMKIGSGLPTSGAAATVVAGGGGNNAGTPFLDSAYDFWFADSSTLYVTDDDNTAPNTGGLSKWTFNGSAWTQVWSVLAPSTIGFRSIAGEVNASGGVSIYLVTAVTSTTGQNSILSVNDLLSGVVAPASFSTVATAGANQVFRGVEFAPVPAPAAAGLLGLAGLAAARRRRA